MKLFTTSLLALLFGLLSCQPKNDPDAGSTNPDDCVLTKISYSTSNYDVPAYDSRGLITSIQSYANGAKAALYTSSVTENLQFALIHKQPDTSPNRIELYSAVNSTGDYTGTLTKTSDYVYQRTANQSGLMAKRTYTVTGITNESGSATYEYSGCR